MNGPQDGGEPGILEFRFRLRPVKLVTHAALVVYSPYGETTFPALRIEDKIEGKRRGVEISLVARHFNWRVEFQRVVPDEHGVAAAAIHLLFRAFEWKETARVFPWEEMPVWRLRTRRSPKEDNLDLWVIAHWKDWNERGDLWDNRFYQTLSNGISPRNTTFEAFKKRYGERMPLVYRPRT